LKFNILNENDLENKLYSINTESCSINNNYPNKHNIHYNLINNQNQLKNNFENINNSNQPIFSFSSTNYINDKSSISDKKILENINQRKHFLKCINFSNQINNVNNINQIQNNLFYPNNNTINLVNYGIINSVFPPITQGNNLNMNFYDFYNFPNFAAINMANNSIKTNFNNNKNLNNNYNTNLEFNNRRNSNDVDLKNKSEKVKRNPNLMNAFEDPNNKNINKIYDEKTESNKQINKLNYKYKNYKKDMDKVEIISSNISEFDDIKREKQNKFNSKNINSTSFNTNTVEDKNKQGIKNVNNNKKKKKPFIEREGDWVCYKCKNLNFSFRLTCNRCQITKEDNEKIFKKDKLEKNKINISFEYSSTYDKEISE